MSSYDPIRNRLPKQNSNYQSKQSVATRNAKRDQLKKGRTRINEIDVNVGRRITREEGDKETSKRDECHFSIIRAVCTMKAKAQHHLH